MQISITAVSRKERTSKKGRPFISLGLKCSEYGERWLSGFGNEANKDWKKGDKVNIEVEDTGEYLNFKMPEAEEGHDSGPAANNAGLAEIKNILRLDIEQRLKGMEQRLGAQLDAIYGLLKNGLPEVDEMPTPNFDEKE